MRSRKLWAVTLALGCCLALTFPAFGQDTKPKPTPKQVSKLAHDLKSQRSAVRASAAEALGQMGAAAAAAVPALIAALKDKDSDVRHTAAYALGAMGSSASAAAPALVESLNDTDSLVRYNAAAALGDIAASVEKRAPQMDAPALTKALTLWQDAQTRLDALHSKAASDRAVSADAQDAVHHLVKVLRQEKRKR